MAGGRPTKYDPKYCQMLIKHMSKGFSFESFAATINCSRDILYDWVHKHEEFRHAKNDAFDKNLEFWERSGLEGMWNEKDGRTLNSTVWIFNMKNRHRWKDKQEIEVKEDSEEEKLKKMSTAELTKLVKQLLADREKGDDQ